jgi:hypothetical protein
VPRWRSPRQSVCFETTRAPAAAAAMADLVDRLGDVLHRQRDHARHAERENKA